MRAIILGAAWLALTLLFVVGPAVASGQHLHRFRASSYLSHRSRLSSYGHTRFRASSYPPIPHLPKPRSSRQRGRPPVVTIPAS
jgi:hypothetical protein